MKIGGHKSGATTTAHLQPGVGLPHSGLFTLLFVRTFRATQFDHPSVMTRNALTLHYITLHGFSEEELITMPRIYYAHPSPANAQQSHTALTGTIAPPSRRLPPG